MEHKWITTGKETRWDLEKHEEVTEGGTVVEIISTDQGCLVDERESLITVSIRQGERWNEVATVYKPDSRWGKDVVEAGVNWSAMGSQGVSITGKFIAAMQVASALARKCNKAYGVKAH